MPPPTKARAEHDDDGDALDPTTAEYQARIVFSMLKPAAQIADHVRLPLKELSNLVQNAYYSLKRDQGMSIAQIARQLGTSTRTIDRIAKGTRANFFRPEREHTLPRRIEFLLWDGPKSSARLQQLLPNVEPEQLADAIERLRRDNRIQLTPGRTPMYSATRRANRLPDDTLAARVDALNNLLDTVVQTIRGRFFLRDTRAGARTVTLRVRRQDIPAIEALYEEVLWDKLVELDDRARDADEDDIVEMGVVVCWSPSDDDPAP